MTQNQLFDLRMEKMLMGLEKSAERIQDHENRINTLESRMICDSRMRLNIKRRVEQRVRTLSGSRENNPNYQEMYRSNTRKLWHDYWNAFGVTTYHDTPAALYDTVIEFIDKWVPAEIRGLEEPKAS
jgi:hypothetical protein